MMPPVYVAVCLLLVTIHVSARPTVTALSSVVIPSSAARPVVTRTQIIAVSTTASAVGVGADGWTTYVEMGVLASEIFEGPSTTRTIPIHPPIAFSQTYEAAASGLRNSDAFGGETCGWGADGWGTCVQEAVHGSTTVTATFSGTGFFYTNAVQSTETKRVFSTFPPPSPTDSPSFIPPTNSAPAPSTSPPVPNAAIGSNGPSLYMWICCTILAGALLSV